MGHWCSSLHAQFKHQKDWWTNIPWLINITLIYMAMLMCYFMTQTSCVWDMGALYSLMRNVLYVFNGSIGKVAHRNICMTDININISCGLMHDYVGDCYHRWRAYKYNGSYNIIWILLSDLLYHMPWTDAIFRCIFENEKFNILTNISLKFVPKGKFDNKLTSV